MSKQEITVNDQDEPIGSKDWWEMGYGDIYRCSVLWLVDSNTGDILIAQRKWTKKNDPGKWSVAVAGTIEVDETYESNIVKETEEEIGLKDIKYTIGPKEFIDDGEHRYFCQWFFASVDKTKVKLTLQEDEVEAVEWISEQNLVQDLKSNPEKYVPSLPNSLALLLK